MLTVIMLTVIMLPFIKLSYYVNSNNVRNFDVWLVSDHILHNNEV